MINRKNTLKFSKQELDSEKWALVTWSNGTYYVSNLGRVKKRYKKHEKILIPYLKNHYKKSSNKKTLYVKIFTDNEATLETNKRNFKQIAVHQLVAEYFLPVKPQIDYVLYHKNFVLSDNRAVNLSWVSKKRLGQISGSRTKKSRNILKIDPGSNKVIDFYKSSRQAAKDNYCSYQTILDSCNLKSKKNCTGYLFKWDVSKKDSLVWD